MIRCQALARQHFVAVGDKADKNFIQPGQRKFETTVTTIFSWVIDYVGRNILIQPVDSAHVTTVVLNHLWLIDVDFLPLRHRKSLNNRNRIRSEKC